MDFMNRGGRPVQQNTPTQGPAADAPKVASPKGPSFKDKNKLARILYVGFVAVVAILVILVIAVMVTSEDSASKEADSVHKDQYQAVFLNGGQVYFGKIGDLNSKYLNMSDIYYLRVNQQVQPDQKQDASQNDISLVKLGCELHGPEDAMTINREQVIFWENLKADGQVAKAVAEYVKANPGGQKCDQQQSSNTNNSGAANTAPATGTTNTTGTNQNR